MLKIYFDIGGTNIEYVVDRDGQKTFHSFALGKLNKNQLLTRIAKIIDDLNTEVVIGISSPTGVDSKSGFCKGLSAIPGYANFNLYEELQRKIKKSVVKKIKAINDGKAALLGVIKEEFSKKEPDSAVMVAFGSGIGGALYINKTIFAGFDNLAGEFGYPLWNSPLNISQSLSPVNFFKNNFGESNGKNIFQNYKVQRKVQIKIDAWIADLASFISFIAFFINPEIIIFNGGVTKNPIFRELLSKEYRNYLEKNQWNTLITTQLLFFTQEKNYSLWGAKALVNL